MKAAIALQCTTGNCVYQDAAPPPTPSTRQGFWTGEMITLLGMTLLLGSILFCTFEAALRAPLALSRAFPTQRQPCSCTTTRWHLHRLTPKTATMSIQRRCVNAAFTRNFH